MQKSEISHYSYCIWLHSRFHPLWLLQCKHFYTFRVELYDCQCTHSINLRKLCQDSFTRTDIITCKFIVVHDKASNAFGFFHVLLILICIHINQDDWANFEPYNNPEYHSNIKSHHVTGMSFGINVTNVNVSRLKLNIITSFCDLKQRLWIQHLARKNSVVYFSRNALYRVLNMISWHF